MNFNVIDKKQLIWKLFIYWYLMSFFHKKNVTKCLDHHYAIWTSDSNFLLAQNSFFGPVIAGPHFRHWLYHNLTGNSLKDSQNHRAYTYCIHYLVLKQLSSIWSTTEIVSIEIFNIIETIEFFLANNIILMIYGQFYLKKAIDILQYINATITIICLLRHFRGGSFKLLSYTAFFGFLRVPFNL